MIRRLGAAVWRKLHRLVYVAAAAAAIHFVLVVKSWPPEPPIYAAIVSALLLFRLVVRLRGSGRKAPRVVSRA
jgi:sulfoxide reductase heme-binding subunit YedZ